MWTYIEILQENICLLEEILSTIYEIGKKCFYCCISLHQLICIYCIHL